MARKHTTFCKRIASAVQVNPQKMDPGFSCRDLDEAISDLGLTWTEVDPEILINVIEAAADDESHRDNRDVYRDLLAERLGR